MRTRRLVLIAPFVLAATGRPRAASGAAFGAAQPLQVVASFTVLADMVRQVGGERVRVASLVGPGGDPHAFQPTPDDARRLRAADLAVVSGLGLEGWMDRLIAASGHRRPAVVLSEGIRTRRMEGSVDPHAWNSLLNGLAYVANIVTALSAADPDGAAAYQAGGARYVQDLRDLDADARRQVAAVPPDRRKVLTSHAAFGYLGDAYGIRFLAPLGASTDEDASAGGVAKLIRQIKAERVQAYFVESTNDPRLVRQIANATGAVPGGTLYAESLSPPDGPAPTYAAMCRHNIDLIVQAMQR